MTYRKHTTHLMLALLFVAASPLSAGFTPPTETLDRINQAVDFLESDDFAGSYTFSARIVIAKTNGKVQQTELVKERVSKCRGCETERHVISAERDGADATRELREERAQAAQRDREQSEDDGEESQSLSVTVQLPTGEDLAAYQFAGPWSAHGGMVASFDPAGNGKAEAGAGSGRLAWDPVTLDPLWIEYTPVDNPKHIKSLSVRFEFERIGDNLYPSRTWTEAVGGFMFIKRRFTAEMTVADVTLVSGSQPSPKE